MERYWCAPRRDRYASTYEYLSERVREMYEECVDGFSLDPTAMYRTDVEQVAELVESMLIGYDERWRGEQAEYGVLANEQVVRACLTAPSGNTSPWVVYSGVVDKLVIRNDRLFVVEHKTSAKPADKWRADNDYSPQGLGYAWLAQKTIKRRIDGIVYDVSWKQIPPSPDSIKLVGTGTPKNPRRLTKVLPPGTTHGVYGAALEMHGYCVDDQEYYRETLDELHSKRDQYHRRFVVPVMQAEIERLGRELYHVATRIRRLAEPLRGIRKRLKSNDDVLGAILAHGDRYARNGNACRTFRRCRYMDVCRYQSVEAIEAFNVSASRYPEITAIEERTTT